MHFWKCIMDGFAKGHSGAHSHLRGSRRHVQIKLERSFLRNCFVMCAFHSRRYTSFLIRQCFYTAAVKPKKWYFGVHWRLWRKVKHAEMKLRKKRSMKLLSNMCIHFRELKLRLCCPVRKLCLWGICEGILSEAWRLVVRKKTSSDENWREAFRATALWCVYSSYRVKSFFGLSSLKSLFLWKQRKDIW